MDPGMGLIITTDIKEILHLAAVRCGAAKRELFALRSTYPSEVAMALAGQSLEVYRWRDSVHDQFRLYDPIGRVMVAAKVSTGHFGSAQKRLLFQAGHLCTPLIRVIQYITELATQRALSPKGGPRPLNVRVFECALRRLLKGEMYSDDVLADESTRTRRTFYEDPGFLIAWDRIRREMPAQGQPRPLWGWLQRPHRLRDLIDQAKGHVIRIPIDDLRVSPFVRDWSGLAARG
jgi:hypothetical protein